jgi:hypothetical protein
MTYKGWILYDLICGAVIREEEQIRQLSSMFIRSCRELTSVDFAELFDEDLKGVFLASSSALG